MATSLGQFYNSVNWGMLLNFYVPPFLICHSSMIRGAPDRVVLGIKGDDPCIVPGT